jgi:hypothetical protein
MIASRPWLGISRPEWLIKSDTPQYGGERGAYLDDEHPGQGRGSRQ